MKPEEDPTIVELSDLRDWLGGLVEELRTDRNQVGDELRTGMGIAYKLVRGMIGARIETMKENRGN